VALTVLASAPIIIQTEGTLAPSSTTTLYMRYRFATQPPDQPFTVDAVIGPLSPTELADPAGGQTSAINARNAAFGAVGFDSTSFANL